MYGASSNGSPMEGIQRVRAIADRDSANLFAQYMLGVGGMLSGQYDRAAIRFARVVQEQPNNLEAWFKLAEAYERARQMERAIATYEQIAGRVAIPEMKSEIEKRIQQLKAEQTAAQ
jgi:lipopolysaccharide biosynthesis regulator YciM